MIDMARCARCAAQEPAVHLKLVAERLGLPLRQFVALMGAHPVARWWRDVQPPYMEQFYSSPLQRVDNTYFRCFPTLLATWCRMQLARRSAQPVDGTLLLAEIIIVRDDIHRRVDCSPLYRGPGMCRLHSGVLGRLPHAGT